MRKLILDKVNTFVNENIVTFHENKLSRLRAMNLRELLRHKNPYLFKAKNINKASDLVEVLLDAQISSSEEKMFGDFLENLAVFIASQTCGGRKSAATGIDLEFEDDGKVYLVSIKSGPNWGNAAQQRRQEGDFQTAVKVLKQSGHKLHVEPVLGICYGKTKTSWLRGYMKVVGQNFWYLLSGNENLYTDIIEPLGYRAKEHNENYAKEKSKIINTFTKEFLTDFTKADGSIDWVKIVEFNSGNIDLKKN